MNTLYPVFLKPDQLKFLVIGGGAVALEKATFLLKSSPDAFVKIVSRTFSEEIKTLTGSNLIFVQKDFDTTDLDGYDIVLAATNIREINLTIRNQAKLNGKLVNVADTPDLCDFYLGSIITRGDLKIAISTNGKSPTFAKRFRQMMEDILPEDIEDLIVNLHNYRNTLKMDFEQKVNHLNDLTASLLNKK